MKSFRKQEKTQRIAVAVLMGMNYVNALMPLGVDALSSAPAKEVGKIAAKTADSVSELFFATAYAGESSPYESADPIIDKTVTVDKPSTGTTTIQNTSIGSGGKVILQAGGNGGLAYNCTISDGGLISVTNYYSLKTESCHFYNTTITAKDSSLNDIIDTSAVQSVTDKASNTTVQNGGTQNIMNYAEAKDAQVKDNGVQNIESKGKASNTSVSNNGIQNVLSGGSAINTSVTGGVQNVSNGGSSSNTIINNGGIQNVSSGGSNINTIVNNGGVQNVHTGATIYGGTVGVGAVQNLAEGVKVSSSTTNKSVVIDGGTQNIYGKITKPSNKEVITFGANGGQQVIHDGGNYTFVTLTGGAQTIMSGGTGGASTLGTGGVIEVQSGGSADVYEVVTGGILTINDGATVVLGYGGLLGGTINVNGGTHEYSKAIAGGNKYGTQNINNGATGIRDILNNTANNITDIQNVNDGIGKVTNIGKNGQQNILKGLGTAGTIDSGGQQNISGGIGTATIVSNGGTQTVSGGSGHVTNLVGSNNTVLVEKGGSQVVSGGIGSADLVKHGGVQIVSGGIGIIEKMEYAGTQIVEGGSGHIKLVDASGATNHLLVRQVVKSGVGIVDVMMNTQAQQLVSGGTGYIGTLGQKDYDNTPEQIVTGGTGIVDNLIRGGSQTVNTGADLGHANIISGYYEGQTYHGGRQFVKGAVGTADKIDGGLQIVDGNTAKAIVNTIINQGRQQIDAGAGSAGTISASGEQIINGGSGHVELLATDGKQTVNNNGIATANFISGGLQDIKGGTGNATALIGGGTQNISAGTIGTADAIYLGGVQNVIGGKADNSNIEGGAQHVRDGIADNTIINAGVQHIYGTGETSNTTLNNGKIYIAEANATVGDIDFKGGEIILGGNSATYNITGKITDGSKGLIDMIHDIDGKSTATMETLNIANISSDKFSILMDVDTEQLTSDKVVITTASGTNATGVIQVNNLSTANMASGEKILLVTENSKTVNFVGKAYNAGGLFAITPTIENGLQLGTNEQDWYLVGLEKRINNDTNVLLTTNDNNYAMWRNTNDSMRKHFGELRRNGELSSNGIWARTLQGKFEGSSFDSSYSMYQLGYDHTFNKNTVYGFAVEHGTGRATYLNGSGEDDLTTFSLYGIWYGKDGLYTNVTGRYGNLNSKVNTYGDYPDTVRNRSNAYSISVEHGKTIALKNNVYIEPQVQLTLGRLGSMNYTTERGHMMNVQGMNSIIGRAGFVFGQKTNDGNELYVTTSILHEFAGRRNVTMYGAGDSFHEVNDYRGTWYELGFGTVLRLNKSSNVYAEFNKTFGGSITQKWQINAGMRVGF